MLFFLFFFISFYFILFFILFLFYFILFYFILFHFISFHFISSYFILFFQSSLLTFGGLRGSPSHKFERENPSLWHVTFIVWRRLGGSNK